MSHSLHQETSINPQVPSLVAILADLRDVRHARGKHHSLLALLTLACVAMLCGADSPSALADWLTDHDPCWRARLDFTHPCGPAQSTFSRMFRTLDIAALEASLARWAGSVCAVLDTACPPALIAQPLPGIALDGKILRGSAHDALPGVHLLSAIRHSCGLVLGQYVGADKTNEITAAPDFLSSLGFEGHLITADALLTQRDVARQLGAAGGDYLFVVKDNQATLRQDVRAVFAAGPVLADTISQAYSTQLHGQRREERALQASTALVGYSDWQYLAQVLELVRVAKDKATGVVRAEWTYAVTSVPPERGSAAQLLAACQGHWEIENRVRWVRDVTFGEDACRVQAGYGPQVLAAVRNAVIGLLRSQGLENIAGAQRSFTA